MTNMLPIKPNTSEKTGREQGKARPKGSPVGLRPRVFVGLSGGVDSAVSAALLKDQGYDVTGVFIKVWQPDFLPCSWREERRDAMRVAIALDIPFLFFDFEHEYKKGVVDKVLAEYKAGRTPNPDVLCNKEVKFGAFWKKAQEMGADFIATGHYARVDEPKPAYPLGRLKESVDKEKDQSYFLWTLSQADLPHVLFPVGGMNKASVREIARKKGLPVSEKKDSQGICFIGDISMSEFVSHFVPVKPGDVLDTKGETIGRHDGAALYTIGERHGFEIFKKRPEDGAFYIVGKDMAGNTITVSNKEPEILSFSPTKIVVNAVNWITQPTGPLLAARIRYRGEKIPATLSLHGKKLAVEFAKPVRGLALGQSIVFYAPAGGEKDESAVCLGGGVMDRVLK